MRAFPQRPPTSTSWQPGQSGNPAGRWRKGESGNPLGRRSTRQATFHRQMREAIKESARRGDEAPWDAIISAAERSFARGSFAALVSPRSQSRWFGLWWELVNDQKAEKRRKRRAL